MVWWVVQYKLLTLCQSLTLVLSTWQVHRMSGKLTLNWKNVFSGDSVPYWCCFSRPFEPVWQVVACFRASCASLVCHQKREILICNSDLSELLLYLTVKWLKGGVEVDMGVSLWKSNSVATCVSVGLCNKDSSDNFLISRDVLLSISLNEMLSFEVLLPCVLRPSLLTCLVCLVRLTMMPYIPRRTTLGLCYELL